MGRLTIRTLARAIAVAGFAALAGPGLASGPPGDPDDRPKIVVLPSADLSGGVAPRALLEVAVAEHVAASGFDPVPEERVFEWMQRLRMRYTGGISLASLEAMRDGFGATGVLIVTFDEYATDSPPRVALAGRLVSTRGGGIVWAREVAMTGWDDPGLLGLGEIESADVLLDKAVRKLLAGLSARRLAERGWPGAERVVWKPAVRWRGHRPRRVFRDPDLAWDPDRPARVAVLPFDQLGGRTDAGEVVSGLFAVHLAGREPFALIEPGEVREALLRGRIIQDQGLSLAQGDLLRELVGAELAVTGRVSAFEDHGGETVPRVAFSVWVIDTRSRSVVWSAYSANLGDDGVVFFDVGRVRSARALAARMVHAAVSQLEKDR